MSTVNGTNPASAAESTTKTGISRGRRLLIIVSLALVGGLAAMFSTFAFSGAWWTDDAPGNAQGSASSLELEATGLNDLQFDGLAPGKTVTDSFSLKNLSPDVDGTASIVDPIIVDMPDVSAAEMANLEVMIAYGNGDVILGWTSATALSNATDLGALNAGQTRNYVVSVRLTSAAGNDWQNETFGVEFEAQIEQVH